MEVYDYPGQQLQLCLGRDRPRPDHGLGHGVDDHDHDDGHEDDDFGQHYCHEGDDCDHHVRKMITIGQNKAMGMTHGYQMSGI